MRGDFPQWVVSEWVVRIRSIEVDEVGFTGIRDMGAESLYQVSMRIDDANATTRSNVLGCHGLNQRGLAGPRSPEQVHVCEAVAVLDAKTELLASRVCLT